MRLSEDVILKLTADRGISQNQLAREIGINRGSLSNALSGRRGVGRKTLAGLLKLFPEESVDSLTTKERRNR